MAGTSVLALFALVQIGRTQAGRTMSRVATASPPLVGPLSVSGSSLVDQGTGKVVDLKGLNSPYKGFDPASITTISDWGANYARVWVSDDLYTQSCKNEVYDPNYVSNLDNEVNTLTSRGIYVEIVDGSTNPNCAFSSPQFSGIAPLPGSQALSMFASLARAFGSNPLVGFELYNEPEICPDSAQAGGLLVPQSQVDRDLALAYPENAVFHPTSALSVPTYGTCDGWKGGFPNWSYSNWSAEQAESLAASALWYGGTVQTLSSLKLVTYTGEGFETLANTLRTNGATGNLIFVDANGFAADPHSFDYLSSGSTCETSASGQPFSPCWANVNNFVAAEHQYFCQSTTTGGGLLNSATLTKNVCTTPRPESCTVISDNLSHLLTDPATGRAWNIPVVLNEFGWPQAAPLPTVTTYETASGAPILVYQHGLYMQNTVSYLDQHHIGWAAFQWDNADQDGGAQTSYVLESNSPVPTSTDTPWSPNADGLPLQDSMQGQTVTCQEPPLGFG